MMYGTSLPLFQTTEGLTVRIDDKLLALLHFILPEQVSNQAGALKPGLSPTSMDFAAPDTQNILDGRLANLALHH